MSGVLVGVAEAEILQVLIKKASGEMVNRVVYRCGPTVYLGQTLDELFDKDRRKIAPDWLVEQLNNEGVPRLSPSGTSKGVLRAASRTTPPYSNGTPPKAAPTDDNDGFGAEQA
jgi:hypothetical protein